MLISSVHVCKRMISKSCKLNNCFRWDGGWKARVEGKSLRKANQLSGNHIDYPSPAKFNWNTFIAHLAIIAW